VRRLLCPHPLHSLVLQMAFYRQECALKPLTSTLLKRRKR
jgi:hypothetical protein